MLKNYFTTAWRSLWKNKFYSIINISGLAVGLATGIMLLLWVQNELSYDKFNNDYQQIYRLSSRIKSNGKDITWTGVPGPVSIFAKSVPDIQSAVRTSSDFDQNLSNKERTKIFDGNVVGYVDSGFFNMFNFHFLKGNKEVAFPNANSVVLTQSTAQKLFGKEEAMGKTIHFFKNNFTVTGVLQNFPDNSSIRYDAIFPMSLLAKNFTENGGNGAWKTIDEDLGDFTFITYVKMRPGTDAAKVGQTLSALFKKARKGEDLASFQLQNLADIHLVSADGNNAALRMVQIFLLVVILLLVIASINYVNLSTARSLLRAKEVSIRKIIGAKKGQLFFQFTVETIVLFCFSTVLAIVLIYLLMPLCNNISGKTLSFTLWDANAWKAIAFAVAGTLIASSIYPALSLSSFKPIESLKGKVTSGVSASFFRKVLVVFQFTISVVLLVCTIVMSSQMTFMKTKDLGYDKSYVFSVPLTDEIENHSDAVKTELQNQPGILHVAFSNAYDFTNIGSSSGDLEWAAKPANSNLMITQVSADSNLIPTLKIKFLEGENFTGTPADSAYFILNKTAVKQMNLKPPYTGQPITFHNVAGTIRGVVKDFNFQSLKEKIAPLIFFTNWDNKNILYVRTNGATAQQAIAAVEKQYKKYGDGAPFSYYFLDKTFEAKYQTDQQAGILFNVFAGIAIFISCLGLFGLATYTAQVKVREIGIRKVLGASVTGIVQLITKDFLQLVLIAIVVAVPIAWWAMNKWLQGFAYRIGINAWVFAVAGIIAIVIALATVSFQAIRAAMRNPVKSLRTE